MTGVFRTCLVRDGVIIAFEQQCRRLERDAGRALQFPEHSIPNKGLYRLRMVYKENSVEMQYTPYRPKPPKTLIIYPYAVEGSPIKVLAYREREYLKEYARDHGADDALLFCSDGFITEVSNANFFYEHNGQYYTADPSLPYLKGLTLDLLKIPFNYVKIRPEELPKEAKCYVANSLLGVIPCTLFK